MKSKSAKQKKQPKPAVAQPKQSKAQPPTTKPTSVALKRRGKLSGLDAAAQVLGSNKQPMNCQDLVKVMLDKGVWKTNGKTPAATLHSALVREITTRAKASRFTKAGRGLFALAK